MTGDRASVLLEIGRQGQVLIRKAFNSLLSEDAWTHTHTCVRECKRDRQRKGVYIAICVCNLWGFLSIFLSLNTRYCVCVCVQSMCVRWCEHLHTTSFVTGFSLAGVSTHQRHNGRPRTIPLCRDSLLLAREKRETSGEKTHYLGTKTMLLPWTGFDLYLMWIYGRTDTFTVMKANV